MDQNSTNGTGSDKRNWRERLGIGAKEIPKLSEEFRSPPVQDAAPPPPPAGTARPAPRAPQPVTRPAPMAPRTPPKPQPAASASPTRPTPAPRMAEPTVQDALAEKLRAQRAAAEKLAEQRVLAARERAEARAAGAPVQQEPTLGLPPRPPSSQPSATTPPARLPAATPPATQPPRPKFSFAEEETGTQRPQPSRPASQPPLTPPRPALGGERSQPPFLRPTTGRAAPPYRATEPGGTGAYTPTPRIGGTQPPRSYGADAPGYGAARPPALRRPPGDAYPRPADARAFGEDQDADPRSGPRLSRPPMQRTRPPRPAEEEFDEVFEDEPPPTRQRASARDYQNAYRETEGGYEEDQRRSSGPWLLLLALLLAAVITGGGVWYYNTHMRSASLSGAAGTNGANVPVVSAPQEPVKTAPETSSDNQGQAPAAARKKQIYDRIVGEQEVTGGQMTPTEEVPVAPAAIQNATEQPAAGASQIPAPDVPAAPSGQQAPAATDEPAPLPLPPPPGNDQQGSLDNNGLEKVAAAAAQPEQGATAPPVPAPAGSTSSALAELPPPESTTDGAVSASGAAKSAAAPPPAESPAVADAADIPDPAGDPEAAPAKPLKKKTAAAAKPASKKKPDAQPDVQVSGVEPVVLVPPSPTGTQAGSPTQGGDIAAAQQDSQPADAPKKKKTLFDLFKGNSATDNTAAAPAEPQASDTQVASIQPKSQDAPAKAAAPEPAPAAPAAASGSGYMVQLSSFRSQAEAQTEYGRLSNLYPTVVGGLPQRIAQSSIAGSTRYQLGLGPLKSRADATRVCGALFQAGERDCIVRSQ